MSEAGPAKCDGMLELLESEFTESVFQQTAGFSSYVELKGPWGIFSEIGEKIVNLKQAKIKMKSISGFHYWVASLSQRLW